MYNYNAERKVNVLSQNTEKRKICENSFKYKFLNSEFTGSNTNLINKLQSKEVVKKSLLPICKSYSSKSKNTSKINLEGHQFGNDAYKNSLISCTTPKFGTESNNFKKDILRKNTKIAISEEMIRFFEANGQIDNIDKEISDLLEQFLVHLQSENCAETFKMNRKFSSNAEFLVQTDKLKKENLNLQLELERSNSAYTKLFEEFIEVKKELQMAKEKHAKSEKGQYFYPAYIIRWRRRWFTLKQGEIPGQFCLEYYTDHNCRKLKGVIDLDQCEQVDSGLRLEHRKQKFQNMFDVKTPHRTYYLAADSQEDMNDWVNCICQVCNLQDLSKQGNDRHYNNMEAFFNKHNDSSTSNSFNVTDTNTTSSYVSASTNNEDQLRSLNNSENLAEKDSKDSTYQNDDFAFRNSMYTNRETILSDAMLPTSPQPSKTVSYTRNKENRESAGADYYNFAAIEKEATKLQTIERSQSMKIQSNDPNPNVNSFAASNSGNNHFRSQSLVEQKYTGTIRKIPENLKLTETFIDNAEPSPALSTCSGPYIPISECFSGSPILLDNENPSTPLNSLDPRFYDTPRCHQNIGLNLTNDQPYSPKRNNCQPTPPTRPRSGRSSPTDSESVFTDDEEWTQQTAQGVVMERHLRPSDSSVENDSFVFTYAQRFSKMPLDGSGGADDKRDAASSSAKEQKKKRSTKPLKRISGLQLLEGVEERNKDTQSSDTENASPAIGPKDNTCSVEESYDIPRSHQLPYFTLRKNSSSISPTLAKNFGEMLTTSTPNLVTVAERGPFSSRKTVDRSHFYTNAAPSKIGGNVFRYDFDEQENAPIVNRSLKPKTTADDNTLSDKEVPSITPNAIANVVQASDHHPPPSIDRKLKPNTTKYETSSMRRKGPPISSSLLPETEFMMNNHSPHIYDNTSNSSYSIKQPPPPPPQSAKPVGQLDYFDLDHSNPPPICNIINNHSFASTSLASSSLSNLNRGKSVTDILSKISGDNSGIVYKSVDFLKTEAIKLTRQDRTNCSKE